MGYFTYTRSEEELKNQYRQLLIKYDYRSGKNKKIINQITKEYEDMLEKIKYDNGERNIGQRVKEGIEGYFGKIVDEQEQEKARRSALENRVYSKQDLTVIVNKQKKYLNELVFEIVSGQTNGYVKLKRSVARASNGKSIYDEFGEPLGVLFTHEVDRGTDYKLTTRLDAIKEELECCVFSLTGKNEKNAEQILQKIDEQLGQYIKTIFLQYEDEIVDPIKELKALKKVEEDKRADKATPFVNTFFKLLAYGPGLFVIFIGIVLLVEAPPTISQLWEVPIPFLVGIGWILFINWWRKIVARADEKRNRVRTLKQQRAQDKAASGISHLISSLSKWI